MASAIYNSIVENVRIRANESGKDHDNRTSADVISDATTIYNETSFITEIHWMMRFLNAEWRKLAITNYEIAPSLLSKYIPAGTELDLW
ncbi:DUF2071 domain-containing protein [Algoriphagus aestuariicola]|uniref:DUF2071 domain-containing protein n=1 Tax=Algoriphagus aestuariicola TaxID=1852016 RepID=A0ABS3BMC6_9BACT|nr:DUF2071 domain-containing protein [Algoriphagus aestuariicola]MBN7799386.1 DUF2071 domain-containing protein [Algoriphagus aestuariicola]